MLPCSGAAAKASLRPGPSWAHARTLPLPLHRAWSPAPAEIPRRRLGALPGPARPEGFGSAGGSGAPRGGSGVELVSGRGALRSTRQGDQGWAPHAERGLWVNWRGDDSPNCSVLEPSAGACGVQSSSAGTMSTTQEVVRSNFEAVLPALTDALATCDFVAMDAEFTGLSAVSSAAAAQARKMEVLDNLEQRYERIKASAASFLIMQLGLSAVRWDSAKGAYEARTFTLYLFPVPYKNSDVRFTCQASSMHFLAQHNFDFNKFVYQGVPYLSVEQLRRERRFLEQSIRRQQQQQNNDSATAQQSPVVLSSPTDRLFVGQQLDRARAWVQSSQPLPGVPAVFTSFPPTAVPASAPGEGTDDGAEVEKGMEAPVLVLAECNSALRAAIYQQLEAEFGRREFHATTVQGPNGAGPLASIQLVRASPAQVQALDEARRAQQRATLEAAGGFARVVEQLLALGKPVVGHNMLLDLAYFFHQFVRPLPPTLDEFRAQVAEAFRGGVYDTKHLVTSAGLLPSALFPGGTSLGTLFSLFTVPSCMSAAAGDDSPALHVHVLPSAALDSAGASADPFPCQRPQPGLEGTGAKDQALPLQVHAPPVIATGSSNEGEQGGSTPRPNTEAIASAVANAHDAGYDAFMTGALFAALPKLICTVQSAQTPAPDAQEGAPGVPKGELGSGQAWSVDDAVQACANQVHVMRCDVPCLPLQGPVPVPDRSATFLVSNLPTSATSASLAGLFQDAGLGYIRLVWLDSSSVIASLADPALGPGAAEALSKAAAQREGHLAALTLTPFHLLQQTLSEPGSAAPVGGTGNRAAAGGGGVVRPRQAGPGKEEEAGRLGKAPRGAFMRSPMDSRCQIM